MPEPTVKGKPRSRNKDGSWRKKRSDAGKPRGPIKVREETPRDREIIEGLSGRLKGDLREVTTKTRTKAQRLEDLREHIEDALEDMMDGNLLYMVRVKDLELLKDPEMRGVLSANHVMVLEAILTRLGYLSPYK